MNILPALALGLALLYAALKPLSDGLFNTSMWLAKVLAPADTVDGVSAQQFLKLGQAALMEGWLSNIPFITSITLFSSLIIAFVYHWWAAVVAYFVAATLAAVTNLVWGRSAFHYLCLIQHKMANRAADYKRDGDTERLSAAESYCRDLENIMSIYRDTRVRPPSRKQLKDIPFGDLYYWRDHARPRL
jgi:hypothetical protein